jgi:putative aldouronate transport system permease protein
MTINTLRLTGTIWALVLPGAVPVFNMVLMLNFFRAIPQELEDAAFMDGANHLNIMLRIFVPISKASIATICLFALVHHWNSWFDGIILMNKPSQYPLQSYLQTVIIQGDTALKSVTDWQSMALISDRTLKCAQIFISTLPIILAYPFLQRYFVKGMVLGSVKG